MAAKKLTALTAFVKQIKDESKAEKSPSATLLKLIDDYCLTGQFDAYLADHKTNLLGYISDQSKPRTSKHRASQVGKCAQEAAFKLAGAPVTPTRAIRPAKQFRALYNGTFFHLRCHVLFDALHDAGTVRTLFAEQLAYNTDLSLSGTVDRVVEFDYLGKKLRAVIDFKSIKSYAYDQLLKPQTDHVWQQHAYELLGAYEANVWIMLYENKDTHEMKIFDRPYDEIMLHKIVRQLKDIERYADQYRLEVPVSQRVDLPLTVDWCRYCSYESLCAIQHPDLEFQQSTIGDDDIPEELIEPVF